jgi:hypothetical protein
MKYVMNDGDTREKRKEKKRKGKKRKGKELCGNCLPLFSKASRYKPDVIPPANR